MRDFRNLRSAVLVPAGSVTVVHGENGQGKTNLLEAIYYLATLRPLRGSRSADLVRLGAEAAEVRGEVAETITRTLKVRLGAGGREATVDEKAPGSVERYAEVLKVVAFTPDDLEIAKGAPATRRRWLDRAAFTRQAGYLADHRVYSRALKARNELLRAARKGAGDAGALAAFDATLATAGGRILARRLTLLDELAPRVEARWRSVTGADLTLTLAYQSALGDAGSLPRDPEGLAGCFAEVLARRAGLDRARGFTTAGPHADDVALSLDDREVRVYASQGQQRAVVLALKVAEIENLEAETGRVPLLLLDDVSSELDPERNAHLLAYLGQFTGQVVLTTTNPSLAPVPPSAAATWVRVEAGVLTPSAPPESSWIPGG